MVAAQAQAQMVASENAETIGFDAIAYVESRAVRRADNIVRRRHSAAHAVQVALDESVSISEGAQAAEEAAMQANDALREGWLADCGAYPEPCMRERAESLAGMGLAENPMASSVTPGRIPWRSKGPKRITASVRNSRRLEFQRRGTCAKCSASAFLRIRPKEVDAAYEVEMPDGTNRNEHSYFAAQYQRDESD